MEDIVHNNQLHQITLKVHCVSGDFGTIMGKLTLYKKDEILKIIVLFSLVQIQYYYQCGTISLSLFPTGGGEPIFQNALNNAY